MEVVRTLIALQEARARELPGAPTNRARRKRAVCLQREIASPRGLLTARMDLSCSPNRGFGAWV